MAQQPRCAIRDRQELNDESYLVLPEQRLDRSHDPGLAADLDVIAELEWLLRVQMASGHDLLSAPKLIAKVDPNHSRSGRYALGGY